MEGAHALASPGGENLAGDELFSSAYAELRRIAASVLGGEGGGHPLTLQPTALVNEVYVRLLGGAEVTWNNRAHFFSNAALVMRRIVIDRARRLRSHPRADMPGDFSSPAGAIAPHDDDLLALDDALERLRARDQRQYDVVMLRYFAGLTIEQTASALDLSISTVKSEWMFARAWLMREVERARKAVVA